MEENRLTNKTAVPFILSFRYPLERGFTFREMTMKHNKEFQSFLDKIGSITKVVGCE